MSFRKEKKYRLTKSDFFTFRSNLDSMGMKPLYATRQINSIYFDTKDLQMFLDSEEGVLPRKKIRVRWYNSSKNYSKELKISSTEGRYKTSSILKDIVDLDDIFKINFFDKSYGYVYPVIKISYLRSYFELNNMRITFDENINYQGLRKDGCNSYSDAECVVEIKIPHDFEDDIIEQNISYQTARFSKFCRGILITEKQISIG
tara:strand:+ start:1886 stop:2494 length:609 start_codon:yes stop_codon:yes gene_type:complete